MNAVEIEEAVSLLSEQVFDPVEFPYSFLEAFGNKPTTIKRLRTGNNNKSDVAGGVLQHNNIHIAVCDEGKVLETLHALKESPATAKARAKFILATDGKDFQAEDLNSGETVVCDYSGFHNHFGFFLSLAGISTVKQIRENAFDIKATSRLNKLYIELLRHNPDWATAEKRHDMNHFLARLIFCFFAEDTDIFHRDGLFTATVHQMSASDASDTHEIISEIFRAMDIKAEDRKPGENVKNWANNFPYVNGDLFSGSTETPRFTKIARSYLLHVGGLDWQQINPDIFGSMIQAVADDEERGALGMHYTSVPNILKVLNPLFLDDLRQQLEQAENNQRKLLNLRKRISGIRVFDPACGSGNFLVIAYKEMRAIEAEINNRRREAGRRSALPPTNFCGIELRDFSAEIARLALIIAEYQCDVLYRGRKLALAEFLPLDARNWITCGNALRLDWPDICPPTGTGAKVHGDDLFETSLDQPEIDFGNEGGETYICGNPPYRGSTWQNKAQKSDLKAIFAHRVRKWKSLDYVAGWFMKAADYAAETPCTAAFVSTNSICQGQQIPILWPEVFSRGQKIAFAHTSFKWANLASHNAGVTVAIIGIGPDHAGQGRRLCELNEQGNTVVREVANINAYLVAGPSVIASPLPKPGDERGLMDYGNKPTDGGHLLMTGDEVQDLGLTEAERARFVRRIYGSAEFIRGLQRYCLWIEDQHLEQALAIPTLRRRIEGVRETRKKSTKTATQKLAETPHLFGERRQNGNEKPMVIPRVSSESREFLPVGLFQKDTIVSDSAFALYDAPLWNMALIASRLHLVWIATVCGKLKTDFRYSNTLGWNTFPVPPLTEKNKDDLTRCAEDIVLAREAHFPATIADLYVPDTMPENLRHAHDRNDETTDRIYIGRRFKNDTERLEKLFALYTKMTAKKKTA